jgi:hypothetical protein
MPRVTYARIDKVISELMEIGVRQINDFVKKHNLPFFDKNIDSVLAKVMHNYAVNNSLFSNKDGFTSLELAKILHVSSIEIRLAATMHIIDQLRDTDEYKKLLKDSLN